MECPIPIPSQEGGGIPIEMIILISVVSGGAVIGVATLLLIIRKRKRIE
jgi:NADH:ubiquinone oxidoreductase subunit K